MKRLTVLILLACICFVACASDSGEHPETTWDFGSEAPYTTPDGRTFQHRLELTGHGNTLVVYTDDDALTYRQVFEYLMSSSYTWNELQEIFYIDWGSSATP